VLKITVNNNIMISLDIPEKKIFSKFQKSVIRRIFHDFGTAYVFLSLLLSSKIHTSLKTRQLNRNTCKAF